MGFPIIIVVFILSFCVVSATIWRLRRTGAGRSWWFAFIALAIVGVTVGSWLALRFEYQISPTLRCASFPVPLAFFHLENGNWIDFVTPPQVMYSGLVANILAVVAVFLLPLLLTLVISHRRQGNEKHVA